MKKQIFDRIKISYRTFFNKYMREVEDVIYHIQIGLFLIKRQFYYNQSTTFESVV